jgi:hypothetical protein
MYFLQVAGEPLRLRYKKAWYGPYAENLRHVLMDVEGRLITGYGGEGDSPDTVLDLAPGATDAAEAFLDANVHTHERLARVGELVEGYETPYGLELLATVHWIVANDRVHEPDQVADATWAWSHRKRRFTRDQIDLALDRLNALGWVDAPTAS